MLEEQKISSEQHLHGPNCGHLSIAHVNALGDVHVGFVLESGDISCYAPQALNPSDNKVPRGSLQNICLKSQGPDFGLHKRTSKCNDASIGSGCWTDSQHYILQPLQDVNLCDIRMSACHHHPPPNDGADEATPHSNHHDHSLNPFIKHFDHVDFLVEKNANGDLDLHCEREGQHCHVHDSLSRNTQMDSSSWIPSLEWLNLFVFANQTSTTVLKITKGLCCKKEVVKLEHLLHDVLDQFSLKMEVNPKTKLMTIWHGSEVKSWLEPLLSVLAKSAVFQWELVTIQGESISTVSVKTNDAATTMLDQVEEVLFVLFENLVVYPVSKESKVLKSLDTNGFNLVAVQNAPVVSFEVEISKGLCCKREVGNVDHALQSLVDSRLVLFYTVLLSKEKKAIVVYSKSPENHVDSQVREQLIRNGFGLKQEEDSKGTKVEEPAAADAVLVPQKSVSNDNTSFQQVCRSVLTVSGVCCAAEIPSVMSICLSIPGVVSPTVSVFTRQVHFQHDSADKQIALIVAKELTDNGFASQVLSNGALKPTVGEAAATKTPLHTPWYHSLWNTKWYVVLSTVLWLISWLSYVGGDWVGLKYCSVVACAFGLPRIAYKGMKSLQRRIMDINVLMTIAVIGALALQDFHEAATVTVIFSWSDWLEERASQRAKGALEALIALKPLLARSETGEDIVVEDVILDQVLIVRTGDKIPVDGVLLSPSCVVDESNLTGESRPVDKTEGDALNAGTLNVSPFWFRMKCTALAKDSAVNRMIALVEEASQSRSPTEQIVERVAKIYTPIVVFVALLLATIPWAFGPEVGQAWLYIALTLLVVACPCALIISTPITYVCSLAQAARFGVLVKGGKYLETLSLMNVLCCDKTGTLTEGRFAISSEISLTENVDLAFELVVKIEEHATHPIAQALKEYAQTKLFPGRERSVVVDVKELELLPGVGVKATFTSDQVALVLSSTSELLPRLPQSAVEWLQVQTTLGQTVCWLVWQGELMMGFAAGDVLRNSSVEFVSQMHSLNVPVVVLTGDNLGSGKVLHQQIPLLQDVFAQLSPSDKVEHVRRLKSAPKAVVGVCGDGVNDAPAFSIASVGIAMGVSGAPLAIETADCALMDNDLTKIPRLVKLARRTRVKIIQNVSFSLVTKAVMLGLTFAGLVSLGVAIAVDVGSMLAVTLNGVSLLEGSRFQKPVANRTSTAVEELA